MVSRFVINGRLWRVCFVDGSDPALVDRTGTLSVATTDPLSDTVYVSNRISGKFLATVMIHELGHCIILSYGLDEDIKRMVYPEYWVEAEEWICNFLADYGVEVFQHLYDIFGFDALDLVQYEVERLVA